MVWNVGVELVEVVSGHVGHEFADDPDVGGIGFLGGVCEAEFEVESAGPFVVAALDGDGYALGVAVPVAEDDDYFATAFGVLVKDAGDPRAHYIGRFDVEKWICVFVEVFAVVFGAGADAQPDLLGADAGRLARRDVDGAKARLADVQVGVGLVVDFAEDDVGCFHDCVLFDSVG